MKTISFSPNHSISARDFNKFPKQEFNGKFAHTFVQSSNQLDSFLNSSDKRKTFVPFVSERDGMGRLISEDRYQKKFIKIEERNSKERIKKPNAVEEMIKTYKEINMRRQEDDEAYKKFHFQLSNIDVKYALNFQPEREERDNNISKQLQFAKGFSQYQKPPHAKIRKRQELSQALLEKLNTTSQKDQKKRMRCFTEGESRLQSRLVIEDEGQMNEIFEEEKDYQDLQADENLESNLFNLTDSGTSPNILKRSSSEQNNSQENLQINSSQTHISQSSNSQKQNNYNIYGSYRSVPTNPNQIFSKKFLGRDQSSSSALSTLETQNSQMDTMSYREAMVRSSSLHYSEQQDSNKQMKRKKRALSELKDNFSLEKIRKNITLSVTDKKVDRYFFADNNFTPIKINRQLFSNKQKTYIQNEKSSPPMKIVDVSVDLEGPSTKRSNFKKDILRKLKNNTSINLRPFKGFPSVLSSIKNNRNDSSNQEMIQKKSARNTKKSPEKIGKSFQPEHKNSDLIIKTSSLNEATLHHIKQQERHKYMRDIEDLDQMALGFDSLEAQNMLKDNFALTTLKLAKIKQGLRNMSEEASVLFEKYEQKKREEQKEKNKFKI